MTKSGQHLSRRATADEAAKTCATTLVGELCAIGGDVQVRIEHRDGPPKRVLVMAILDRPKPMPGDEPDDLYRVHVSSLFAHDENHTEGGAIETAKAMGRYLARRINLITEANELCTTG